MRDHWGRCERIRVVSFVAAGFVWGCNGEISDPGGTFPEGPHWTNDSEEGDAGVGGGDMLRPLPGTVREFECIEASSPDSAHSAPLRRLSRRQYRNTVESFVRHFYSEGPAAQIVAELERAYESMPRDGFEEHPEVDGQRLFSRSDQRVSDALVRGQLDVAQSLAGAMTADAARVEAWAGPCATDGQTEGDAECIDAIVDRIGRLTHRRPLTAAESQFYRSEVYADGDTVNWVGLKELLSVLLTQPAFVTHLEGTGELTAHEAASRLSYMFWNSMPDAELFAAAADGSLLTDSGWRAQVTRLLRDERARSSFDEFLREWFKFDRAVPLSHGGGPAFETLRGALQINDALDAAINAELSDLFAYVVRSGGSLRDFFLSDQTLTQSPELAALYGMLPSRDGSAVQVPPERRSILTRAASLLPRADISTAGPGPRTHPILRGVFLVRQILCATIQPPPANAMDNLPAIDTTQQSSREAAEIMTGSGTCASCHELLNAPGFALEAFDGLAQHRAEELLFDNDGNLVGSTPVDTSAEVFGFAEPVSGGVELSQQFFDAGYVSACFARHYVRYALGRPEEVDGADACLLHRIDEALDSDAPLSEVLSMVVLDAAFRFRGEPIDTEGGV